jgi:hypothetical protein
LNRSLRGSESKDEDMADYVRAATLLAEKFQCAVIVIHHCGHNEQRPRGHSSLLGAVDALIEIKKDERGLVHSEVEEMRDGPTGQTTVSRLEVVDVIHDVNGESITSCVIVEADVAPKQQRKTASKPPSPKAVKFHAALLDAMVSHGTPRPQSAGRISVTKEQWIIEAERLGLVDRSLKSDSCRSEMSRAQRNLITADWIACNGDFVWNTREEK